ncbi:prefoldin subunit alpha [Halobacteriales archaeon QS_3_64_16]|nr:MAG: prefoldin subunit alpha [Halobacteriales archaeon QS_3_64_16]
MSQAPGGGGGRQQLQQLAETIQALDEEREELEADIAGLRNQQEAIDEAIEGIETLEDGSIVQMPLGGGAYVRAEVQDIDEIVVDIGGDYAAEREQEGAISSLEAKRDRLDDRVAEVEAEVEEIEEESNEIEQRAQQAQQQMQQQQMQQMQGRLGSEGEGEPDGE